MQNGYIESFKGKFRDECLNVNYFSDLADAREKIETWRVPYNLRRAPNNRVLIAIRVCLLPF